MKLNKIMGLKLTLILTAILGMLFIPSVSFASTHQGGGNVPGGGGGGGWDFDNAEHLQWWSHGSAQGVRIANHASGGATWDIGNTAGYAYIYGNGRLYSNDWTDFDWLFSFPNRCNYSQNNKAGQGIASLPAEFREQANKEGYYLGTAPRVNGYARDAMWYNSGSGKYLDAIALDGEHWEDRTESQYKKVLIYESETTSDGERANIDFTAQDDAAKFNNAPTSTTYKHATNPDSSADTFKVKATVQKVKQFHTYKYNPTTGATKDHKWSYDSETPIYHERTISYNADAPTISQEKYAPMNINRQGYARTGDNGIGSDFVNGKKLDMKVSNSQNKSDNSTLNALDLNADTRFNVTFNNNCLGLDASYDWFTKPEELRNGSFELTNRDGAGNISGPYANGRKSTGDSTYRWNLTLNAGITTSTEKKNIDTASIKVNGKEYVASSPYITQVSKTTPLRSLDCSARFIYIGDYNLRNTVGGAAYPNYWAATYNMGRFYEYGVIYSGTVNTGGISAPSLQASTQANVSATGNGWSIRTDCNAKQRGLYVGTKTTTCVQPLVTGNFKVKTVAGDLTKNK